jgi:hypothetical protein
VRNNDHTITAPYERGQFLTQHLVSGLNILRFASAGDVLAVLTDEKEAHPFLSAREQGGNRTVLVSDFATWSSAASFFRNEQPRVFYANLLYPVLIRALQWAVYGDVREALPAPQASNAALTAILRLDADDSDNLDAQVRTVNTILDISRESGVVPVYAWVSDGAAKAGWPDLAPLGKGIEDAGGEIGSHSRFHRIDREMNERRWKEELDDAVRDIEFNMSDYDHPIGKVECFVNPGNTIHMDDYGQLARRFMLYMTHGFEQDMPIGYGNLTWYTGPDRNFVVLEDSPSPDYQWFYDPTWSYTTQQVTAYEECIFDHLFRNIGRGVVFNQMWHDYAITAQPQYGKIRIVNESHIALYDALKVKFSSLDIYCPTPEDLTRKLQAMAQWNYRWRSDGRKAEIVLDLSSVRVDTIPYFVGGMGLRMDNTDRFIQEVRINGAVHCAFSDQLVILPNLKKGRNSVEVTLGPDRARSPRLTYISKRMPEIRRNGEDIEFTVLTKSPARFSLYTEGGTVLINADRQEWNRNGDRLLRGVAGSDRKLTLKRLRHVGFALSRCPFPILEARESASGLTLVLGRGKDADRALLVTTPSSSPKASLNGRALDVAPQENLWRILLPDFEEKAELNLVL